MEKPKKKRRTLYQLFFKRFFDFILSLLALIILSPILLIVIIINAIILKGNPFFTQYRPGKNGKIFKMYKFRSMTNKMDENGNLLPDSQRITKFGKFLRASCIDELPQLFNILKGDMSIIGPRPRLVKDLIFYTEEALKAFSVRPGLSSPSQVNGGRSTASWDTIFEDDLNYSQNVSLFKDIGVIFKTVFSFFSPKLKAGYDGNSQRGAYLYCDYLLQTGKITQEQYNLGLQKAEELIKNNLPVTYQKELHNVEEKDDGIKN